MPTIGKTRALDSPSRSKLLLPSRFDESISSPAKQNQCGEIAKKNNGIYELLRKPFCPLGHVDALLPPSLKLPS